MMNMYPVLDNHVLLHIQPGGGYIGKLGAACEFLNETAVEILELCTGSHTVENISHILAERHDEQDERAQSMVSHFLNTAQKKGHITFSSEPAGMLGIIAGNKEYYTPMDLSFDITLQCDLKCIHCYAEAGSQKDIFSTEELITILGKIRAAGITKIVLTGGDPPARADFLEIVKASASQFLIVDIATNGYRIDEEMVKKIMKLDRIGIITFRLSIDGMEENHDRIRGVKGSWRKALKALRLLARHGLLVSVTMTLNSQNIHDLEDVIMTARTEGAVRFSAGMTLEKGRACNKNLELTKEQKEEVIQELKKLKEKYASPRFYVSTWVGVSERDETSPKSVNCGAGHKMYSIDYTGNVKPCPSFGYTMGNVESGLDVIFKSPITQFFAQLKWPTRDMCGDCQNYHICTECHAAALVKSKTVAMCPWANQWDSLPSGCENPVR